MFSPGGNVRRIVIGKGFGNKAGTAGDDGAWHSAKYPIELAIFLSLSYSAEGDVVLDPFIGSGTTGVFLSAF
jgi:DNA modification methylase